MALEWLLVVAALAGLAAVGVVGVQRAVDETAEGNPAFSARAIAAAVAASEVEHDARSASAANPRTATWTDWENHFTARCARLEILYRDADVDLDAAFAWPTSVGGADPISEAVLAAATEGDPAASVPQARCNIGGLDSAAAAGAAPPLSTVEDFRRDAQAIADAAATLRPGDTWATWKAHFERLCSDLAIAYAHLNIGAESSFNEPQDKGSIDAVTQDLLDAATTAPAADGRPQIKCQVQQ